MTHLWSSWCVHDIMTNFVYDKLFDVMTYVALIDVMTNVLTSWNFLTWHICLRHDAPFWGYDEVIDVMVCCLCSDEHFLVMTYFFSLFQEQNIMKVTCFWLHDKLFDIMTYLWLHGELFMYFWRRDKPFDVMTYYVCIDELLTSWCVFDVMTSWRMSLSSRHVLDISNPMANVLTSWRILRHEFLTSWRTFSCYDAIKLSWGKCTTIISITYIWNYFGHYKSAIIKMHDPWYKHPLQSLSGMLAQTHVLYLL